MHKQVHDSNYIVKFFGITKHPLTHDTCIVMQFAENGCLQDFLENQNISITWLTKYRLAWEISSGLDFIHRENIFHTDLHSRNILIDTNGKALITDFGLSKSVNKTIYTTKAGLFGVVPYVAPERMQNPTYTYNAKCDIYSLGVIFWELSSCVIPFEMQLQDVMLAVNIIAGVREKTVPGTAVEYEMLYRRCWDGLPQNRPSMDIVLSELVELLAAEQINPRPAAPRPMSPRAPRPLSCESVAAPSTPFPYDNDPAIQSSPENSTPMHPSSPSQRQQGARQSIAQGLNPVPSVPPVRQEHAGVRAPNGAAQTEHGKANNAKPAAPIGRVQPSAALPDSPTVAMTPGVKTVMTEQTPKGDESQSEDAKVAPTAPQLLPPLPSFKALALTTPPNDISVPAPVNANNSVLPETASLALANGISMVSVVSKLNLGSIKTISTISPPPHGAPPPPPGSSNTPRVISPPASRPKVVSPPKARNNQAPRVSNTISPPTGNQRFAPPPPPPGTPPPGTPVMKPSASPSLSPSPKPPAGPPPSPSVSALAKPPSEPPRNPASPIVYVPATTYSPAASKGKPTVDNKKPAVPSESSESDRATPPRPVPMGFPVVTPLEPHVFKRTPPNAEHSPSLLPSPPPSSSSSPGGSVSTAPSQKNSRPIDVKNIALRANSPDLSRKDNELKNSRPIELGKPSMENAGSWSANPSPSLSPSPAASGPNPPARHHQGFFPVVPAVDAMRAGLSKGRDLEGSGENVQDNRADPREMRHMPKETTPPPHTHGADKPRVQFDNFYSLSDPYKDLNLDDPSDFFTAVTQSDIDTVERMLKIHPYLIQEAIGFWPHPTPILVAARSRHPLETMKVLVRHGAALDRGDHNGTTVLHFVCEQYPNPVEAITFLTKVGADCNSRDGKKRTPLMVLLQNAHISSTKVLIETMRALFMFGAQTKVADQQHRTPLHYAIQYCKEPAPVIELLLKKGAEVNAIDSRKATPMHMVLERMDNEEIVQMLLLYGADPSIKNGNKRNALCVAAEYLRVMSAWFLLENDLMSSAPETVKKASELCSKADGPDKNSKPLFKNLLSDWQGKEGKLRRIQLAQDCVLRVQRTPDMKTIDQTQVALEFLESAGVPIHMSEQDHNNHNNNMNNSNNNNNNSVGNINSNNNGTNNNNNNNNHGVSGYALANGPGGNTPGLTFVNASYKNNHHGNGHVQVKELRLAEGVEPLKQIMLPVKSVQQLEKEREAIRNQVKFTAMNSAF
ncbi:hypothetical protein BGX21_003579 [Mortierella sp. AD011]|nr:hypothetical protein BGX20_003172 [Mortierella sp. AD010]KAF9376130.1 hypothetical protein BGX21_003579 [Mortierella sp. AD011]